MATAVRMTGLTPYMLVDLTKSKVNQAREYDQTLSLATSTTLADIKKQQSKKAVLPTSFQALVDTLWCFTNFLVMPLLHPTHQVNSEHDEDGHSGKASNGQTDYCSCHVCTNRPAASNGFALKLKKSICKILLYTR